MPVRKTEQRLPANFVAEDLGHFTTSSDGKSFLVSFNSNPITIGLINTYVVFVTDVTLIGQIHTYKWTIQEGENTFNSTTEVGYFEFRPTFVGSVSVQVELKSATAVILSTIQLDQSIVELNADLETLFSQTDEMAPLAGRPETSREIINTMRAYMDELAPRDADSSSSLNRLLFAIAYVEVMGLPAEQRNLMLEQIAAALDTDDSSVFSEQGVAGIGVCRIRPHVLGTYLPETPDGTDWYIAKREFPESETERLSVDRELRQALEALAPAKQIDLFNLLRFPKSNLKMAIQLLEGLKDQYFSSDNLETLINDKEEIQLLIDQFKRGPYQSV